MALKRTQNSVTKLHSFDHQTTVQTSLIIGSVVAATNEWLQIGEPAVDPGHARPDLFPHTKWHNFETIPVSVDRTPEIALLINRRASENVFLCNRNLSEGEKKWFSMETYDNVQ